MNHNLQTVPIWGHSVFNFDEYFPMQTDWKKKNTKFGCEKKKPSRNYDWVKTNILSSSIPDEISKSDEKENMKKGVVLIWEKTIQCLTQIHS